MYSLFIDQIRIDVLFSVHKLILIDKICLSIDHHIHQTLIKL